MKINENDKITLTIGQLKRLVSEAKRPKTIWVVFTDDLDQVDNVSCNELAEIVSSCKSNYRQCHRKTLEWLYDTIGGEFGDQMAREVTRNFGGVDGNTSLGSPFLMFTNERTARTVAKYIASITNEPVNELYGPLYGDDEAEWNDDVEESQINEWEEWVDDNGYSHDDEGNVEYVGKSWSGDTYGLDDGPHGSGFYKSRYPVRMKKEVPCWGRSSINLKEAPDGNCPHCGEKLNPWIGRDTTYKKRVSVGHCEKCGVNYKIPEEINTAIQNASPDLCPDCGAKLVKREGKYGEFYSCPRYPDCEFHCSKAKFDKAQQTGKLIGL